MGLIPDSVSWQASCWRVCERSNLEFFTTIATSDDFLSKPPQTWNPVLLADQEGLEHAHREPFSLLKGRQAVDR